MSDVSTSSTRAALQRQLHQAARWLARLVERGRREGWLEGDPAAAAALAQDAPDAADDTLVGVLAARLALTPTMHAALWVLVACELDPRVRRLVEGVQGRGEAVTVGTLIDAVYAEDPAAAALELAPGGPLARLALVEIAPADAHLPLAARRIRVRERVLELACGIERLDPALDGIAAIDEVPATRLADLVFAAADRARLQRVLAGRPAGLVVLHGRAGTGRRTVLCAAVTAWGERALRVDARALPREPEALRHALRVIAREARLLELVPVVRDLDALDGAGDDATRLALVEQELTGAVLATTTQRIARRWARPPVIVELGELDTPQRAELWRQALPSAADGDADILANLYPLAPALIAAVGEVARREAADAAMTPEHIAHGVRVVLDDRLAGLATRMTVTQTWDDLVLPDDQATAVIELLARVRERRRVFEAWGFGDKIGKGTGTVALFSGPPGTGKSMAAGLVAASLHVPLYRVDLSKIVSKWIGETEKNLATLFDAAEAGHAVLLFDEADALFGKRTEVRTSQDRHANQEVNYLLQRIEAFAGICLLTSNHEAAIDEAFRRRLSLHVRFPLPEASERRRLWQALLPATAPTHGDLGLDALAQKYVMSGGYIKNAVLRAAFLAADEDGPITGELLARAAQLEVEAMGRVVARV